MRALALALLLVASCADKIPDVCGTRPGTCIAIDLSGPSDFKFDQLSITADTIMIRDQLTPPGPRVPAVAAPVTFALVPGEGFAGGPFQLEVVARLSGTAIGSGSTLVNVGRGQHIRVGLTLVPFGGGDMGPGDMSMCAVAGTCQPTDMSAGSQLLGAPLRTSLSGARAVFSGELNADGKLDLVVGMFGAARVMFGNGTGGFTNGGNYTLFGLYGTGAKGQAIAVADFNRDGKLDFAVGASDISVLLNEGNGLFTDPGGMTDGGVAPIAIRALALIAADMNFDTKPDLVAVRAAAVDVLIGNGDGTFQPAKTVASGGVDAYPSVVAGDFNGDGNMDVAVHRASQIAVFYGTGSGNLGAVTSFGVSSSLGMHSVLVGEDFNGDGKIDLAGGTDMMSAVSVLIATSAGFQSERTYGSANGSVGGLGIGDLDGDGKLDLVAHSTDTAGTVTILLGNGDGTFAPSAGPLAPVGGFAIAVGEFTGDGKLDVATTDLNLAIQILPNIRP